MAGDIEVNEGKLWMVAGWVFRNVIEDTLPFIPKPGNENLLSAIDEGFGEEKLEYISLIGIPIGEKREFLESLKKAFRERELMGSRVFSDPSFYSGYMEQFQELIEIVSFDVFELEKEVISRSDHG